MNRYRVDVVASYGPGVDLFRTFAQMPEKSPGLPDIKTTALDMIIEESVRIPPKRQTLTAKYEVRGPRRG
jgi:hypothetical protein